MPDAGTVYQQYRDMVYGYLFRLCQNHDLAEELTQETFYQALKRWNGFRGKSDIGTWLCSIARNQYFQILRRKKEQPAGDAERETEPDFSEMVINRGIAIDAYKALHHLPEPYREVFSLRTFSDLNYREISEVFGKTESWHGIPLSAAPAGGTGRLPGCIRRKPGRPTTGTVHSANLPMKR